jgi:hypothetical protein
MNGKRSQGRGPFAIFRVPLVLAAVSGAGLISALLFDGPADLVCTLAIAVPLLAILRALRPSH